MAFIQPVDPVVSVQLVAPSCSFSGWIQLAFAGSPSEVCFEINTMNVQQSNACPGMPHIGAQTLSDQCSLLSQKGILLQPPVAASMLLHRGCRAPDSAHQDHPDSNIVRNQSSSWARATSAASRSCVHGLVRRHDQQSCWVCAWGRHQTQAHGPFAGVRMGVMSIVDLRLE
jgi:hypothetical protein